MKTDPEQGTEPEPKPETDPEQETVEPPEAAATPPSEKDQGVVRYLGELPVLVVIAFLIALMIKTFFLQAFFIPSGSMEPTLMPGDRVLVQKVSYYFHDPRRGDIIVFEDPHPGTGQDRGLVGGFFHWMFQGLGVQKPSNEDFVKRVIGLPGETISAHGGNVFVNGVKLREPYLTQKTADFPAPWCLPAACSSWATTEGTRSTHASGWVSSPRTRSSGKPGSSSGPRDATV